jgi:two-component system, OmpR family, phosphate regulon sensor histidine kinase PhoR
LAKSLTPRLAAVAFLSLLPAAIALVALAIARAVSPVWVVLVIALGAIAGGYTGLGLARAWKRRAERLDAVAEALERREPPSHLVPDERDAMTIVERRLLDAADAVAAEVESIEEQREEFSAILRSMTEAVVVTGAHGDVVLLNGAARRMFGLQPEASYRGRDFVELCRDPRLQEFVGRTIGPDQSELMTAELLIQNPATRYLEVNAAPVRHAGGIPAARVLVFHDITRLKSYETVRADFVANLTHEVRTPLTALYGYAETLQKGVDDPETEQRFLGIIERQSRRLARLIDDLISLSDLERGLTPLKFEPLEPSRVLEEAAELLREQARRTGVTLEVRSSPDLPEVSADHDRLHQVMLNLLDNAIKYTPRGGSVGAGARTSLGSAADEPVAGAARTGVEFVIADTGEGIPAADIPRLTERFYRVDRARSRELGGTGLGLAIVKHIVQLHHGRLKIESRLREGTTVTVWLPVAQSARS